MNFISLICGISSLVVAVFCAFNFYSSNGLILIIAPIIALIGIICGTLYRKKNNDNTIANIGLLTSIASEAIGIVIIIVFTLMLVFL